MSTSGYWKKLGSSALVLTAVLVGTSSVAYAAPSPSKCSGAVFIGLRGTGEAAGASLGEGGRTWNTGGTGSVTGLSGNFRYDGDLPFWIEAINYPASAFPVTNGPTAPYAQSMATGRDNLRAEVEAIAAKCPYSPIVLAGYSQGAQIIGDVLAPESGQPSLTANARAHLSGIAFFDDPSFRPNQSFDAAGAGTGSGVFVRSSAGSNVLSNLTRYMYASSSATAPTNVPMIRSYCKTGDRWCQKGLGSNAGTIHESYQNDAAMITDAYYHIRRFLVDGE